MPRGYVNSGKNADPEFRRQRARDARAAQLSIEHYVQGVVARAPELTEEQKAILRPLVSQPDGGASA
ncbi:hypothetical protein ACIPX0_12350 [Streptomyces sp. NPDC090075]|uniref:hypothetical protein n=1 Tax=Streptomyces sp. NPDC090075 TaxID=3365937 RepID=UPI00382FBDBE